MLHNILSKARTNCHDSLAFRFSCPKIEGKVFPLFPPKAGSFLAWILVTEVFGKCYRYLQNLGSSLVLSSKLENNGKFTLEIVLRVRD